MTESSYMNLGQLQKVIDVIYKRSGYDFNHYSKASFARRLDKIIREQKLDGHRDLINKLGRDSGFFPRILPDLTVSTTEMFRDPEVYQKIYDEILSQLATYPSIRIWHAGCSTGEEVYSLAVLLKEKGIYQRCSVYATDIDEKALARAKKGIYKTEDLREYTRRFYRVGGDSPFSDYYHSSDKYFAMDASLRERVLFSTHNLATDGPFGHFHLIMCRNVMIYFDRELQARALSLFHESLERRGFLVLGSKESVDFTTEGEKFFAVDKRARIFQKERGGGR